MPLRATRLIAAPPERVFRLLDEPEQVRRWMQGLEEMTFAPGVDRSDPVGARFTQRLREGGRVAEYQGEILAHERPSRLSLGIGNEHFAVDVDYRLTPDGPGTRLDYTAVPSYRTLKSRMLDALFRPLTAGLLKRQMDSLKRVAEER